MRTRSLMMGTLAVLGLTVAGAVGMESASQHRFNFLGEHIGVAGYDPVSYFPEGEIEAFLVAETLRPIQTQAVFTILPSNGFGDRPALDAFLIPGEFGTRQEMHNARLHDFVRELPESCLLTSVCTGSWIYARMGLLDGLPATSRKEPDRLEASSLGMVPIDRLAQIAPACRISRARLVDAGRIITAGGIAAGMEMGFHLLRRAGYEEDFVSTVARVMEYARAYEIYRDDREVLEGASRVGC